MCKKSILSKILEIIYKQKKINHRLGIFLFTKRGKKSYFIFFFHIVGVGGGDSIGARPSFGDAENGPGPQVGDNIPAAAGPRK